MDEKYLLFILVPLILSNVIHMILVKKNALPALAIPVAVYFFGTNKTWRGFVVVSLLNGLLAVLLNLIMDMFGQAEAFCYGFLLGFVYILFELPNSWIKRRMGIAAGERSEQQAGLFMLLDKTDSALGVSLMSHFLFVLSWGGTLKLFIIAVIIHVFFSWVLVLLGVKKRF
jgi:CDP-archaeol synthase